MEKKLVGFKFDGEEFAFKRVRVITSETKYMKVNIQGTEHIIEEKDFIYLPDLPFTEAGKNMSYLSIMKTGAFPELSVPPKKARVPISEQLSEIYRYIKNNDVENFKRMIQGGFDLTTKNRDGRTILFSISSLGRLEMLRFLLSLGVNVNEKDRKGYTPLMASVSRTDDTEIVQSLLSYGADINAQNKSGTTALIIATRLGKPDMIRLLIRSKADLYIKDNKGKIAIRYCSFPDCKKLFKEEIDRKMVRDDRSNYMSIAKKKFMFEDIRNCKDRKDIPHIEEDEKYYNVGYNVCINGELHHWNESFINKNGTRVRGYYKKYPKNYRGSFI